VDGRPRDLLLIVLDGARRDHLRSYGHALDTMPALTALASECVVFEDAVTPSTGTNPALASLFTGLLPRHHGLGSIHDLGQTRLRASVPTLAELLTAAGYRGLAGFSRPLQAEELAGLGRGFERVLAPGLFADGAWTARELQYRLRPDLDRLLAQSDPFFLCVVFSDARSDQPAPGAEGRAFLGAHLDPFRARRADLVPALDQLAHNPEEGDLALRRILARARGTPEFDALRAATHDGNLLHLDRQLEVIFERLQAAGRWEETLVVVTGTCGENLEARPETGGPDFAAVLVDQPLLLRLPGLSPGREPAPVTLLDLTPTLLDCAGLQIPTDLDGTSWLALLEHGTPAEGLRPCESTALDRVAILASTHQVEDRLSGEPQVFERSSGRLVSDDGLEPAAATEVGLARARLAEVELEELWILRHLGSAGDVVSVDWRFLRGHAREQRCEGPGVTPSGGRAGSATRGAASFGAGEGRLLVRGARRDLPLELRLRAEASSALDARCFVGTAPLLEHPLPRVPAADGAAWPQGAEEATTWQVDFEHAGESWWRLTIPGPPGVEARVLLARYPPERVDLPLEVTASNGRVEPVSGRADAVWVLSVTPLTIDLVKKPSENLALSVALDGRQVPVANIRWRGREFSPAGEVTLYLPDWMAGVTDALDRRGGESLALEPGGLQLLRRTSGLPPEARSALTVEELGVVRFLPPGE
jgi:hypothetical protein